MDRTSEVDEGQPTDQSSWLLINWSRDTNEGDASITNDAEYAEDADVVCDVKDMHHVRPALETA